MESKDILKRIDELLILGSDIGPDINVNASELAQGCVSLLTLVYGARSAQVEQFNASLTNLFKEKGFRNHLIAVAAQGTLRNLKREIEAGLTGSLRSQITGEVLTDLIQLARVALNESGDSAKNVAAVLAAAAFEDTIRRMGESLAGVMGENDLAEVLKKLREAGVIQSPQVGIAQSYLNFRNHALHANWDKVQRESVQSVLASWNSYFSSTFNDAKENPPTFARVRRVSGLTGYAQRLIVYSVRNENNGMLLVVFGAGASFDSVPHRPPDQYTNLLDRPPLANQLFDDRPRFVLAMSRYPQCKPVIPLLRTPSENVTVEQVLARLQREAEHYTPRHQQLAAIRYYLQSMLLDCQSLWQNEHRGITNYKTLLDQIEHWRASLNERVCLLTFNYDTMLEQDLSEFLKVEFVNVQSYVLGKHYLVVKLHGSINWGREVDGITGPESYSTDRLINEAATLQISNRYRIANPTNVNVEGRVVFPAVAIPVENKSTFECPDEHLQALTDALPQVNKILTIGWRATEQHFLKLLAKHVPKTQLAVMVVCGSAHDAQATFDNLLGAGLMVSQYVPSGEGFTSITTKRTVEDFLRGRAR